MTASGVGLVSRPSGTGICNSARMVRISCGDTSGKENGMVCSAPRDIDGVAAGWGV